MPATKVYDIVTNDRYELPVKYHLVGAKAVAKYIGMTENKVRKCLYYGKWNGEYKAVAVGRKKPEGQKAWERRYLARKAVQNG